MLVRFLWNVFYSNYKVSFRKIFFLIKVDRLNKLDNYYILMFNNWFLLVINGNSLGESWYKNIK